MYESFHFLTAVVIPQLFFCLFSPVLDDRGFDGSCFSRGEATIVDGVWCIVSVKPSALHR